MCNYLKLLSSSDGTHRFVCESIVLWIVICLPVNLVTTGRRFFVEVRNVEKSNDIVEFIIPHPDSPHKGWVPTAGVR
jgi:hypothetical protein